MDTELVVRTQNGDRVAFASLAAPLYARLHRVAYSILSDAHVAEDATQQAMLRVWRNLPSLRDPARLEAWAYRTIVPGPRVRAHQGDPDVGERPGCSFHCLRAARRATGTRLTRQRPRMVLSK